MTTGSEDALRAAAGGGILLDIDRSNAAAIMEAYQAMPEPSAKVLDHATYILSEWLNDAAPIGERRYREPARALLKFATLSLPSSGDQRDAVIEEWRNMESAPRDGTHILARGVRGEASPPTTVHWFGPPDLPGLRAGGWYISVQQNEGGRVDPTGWMPLPLLAPQSSPVSGEGDEAQQILRRLFIYCSDHDWGHIPVGTIIDEADRYLARVDAARAMPPQGTAVVKTVRAFDPLSGEYFDAVDDGGETGRTATYDE